jgi:periplasmic divalent cation tolerance protein
MAMTACVALITAPNLDEARRLARALVEEQLAACVNLLPAITSIYRWEGAVHEDREVLLLAKTTRASTDALTARVLELHSYAVPEVIVLPIVAGSAAYLRWIASGVGGQSGAE